MRSVLSFTLSAAVVLGCSGASLGENAFNQPSYQDYLGIQTGSSCSGARAKISGEWKLDSSSEFGDPGDDFYIKSEMWSISGGFWSVSIMCSNGKVDFVSQFGLD